MILKLLVNYVNIKLNYNNLPEDLACIHNYVRNSYLLDNNIYQDTTQLRVNSMTYMDFSQERIKDCSYSINQIISLLDTEYDVKKKIISDLLVIVIWIF